MVQQSFSLTVFTLLIMLLASLATLSFFIGLTYVLQQTMSIKIILLRYFIPSIIWYIIAYLSGTGLPMYAPDFYLLLILISLVIQYLLMHITKKNIKKNESEVDVEIEEPEEKSIQKLTEAEISKKRRKLTEADIKEKSPKVVKRQIRPLEVEDIKKHTKQQNLPNNTEANSSEKVE